MLLSVSNVFLCPIPKQKSVAIWQRYLRGLDVDQRTVRRWCKKGVVPGAHRAKNANGHWRVVKSRKASIVLFQHPPKWHRRRRKLTSDLSEEAKRSIDIIREELSNQDSPVNLASQIYFACQHQITYEEIVGKLCSITSEARHDLFGISVAKLHKQIPLWIWQLAQNPASANLYIATSKLRFKELSPSAKALAGELGISRASLYRKYSPEQNRQSAK